MSTRVAIYARVSTTNHGQDVGLQTRELRQFAQARGWSVAGEYIDADVSGATDSRPALNPMLTNDGSMSCACGGSIGSLVLSSRCFLSYN
jgi:Resolvase, N terminal domain